MLTRFMRWLPALLVMIRTVPYVVYIRRVLNLVCTYRMRTQILTTKQIQQVGVINLDARTSAFSSQLMLFYDLNPTC